MAQVSITVRPSYRDIRGRFVKADEQVLTEKREAARVLGREWKRLMRQEAPKKTGRFADGIGFRTKQTGEEITMEGFMPQPLGSYITEGTKAHIIAARNAGALRFFWPKVGMLTFVPKNGGFPTHVNANGDLIIGKGFVNHPGTKPNKFNERAFDKWYPSARVELNRIAVNWRENATK